MDLQDDGPMTLLLTEMCERIERLEAVVGIASAEWIRDADGANETPEFGTEDYRRYAALFNDITAAPKSDYFRFSDRQAMTKYLWAQGWRRDVRPEDVTE